MIPLHEPRFDDTDIAALADSLRSSWVSTGGPAIDLFENEMAAYVGTRFGVAVANGTVGLQLMIETLRRQMGIKEEFEVLVPTLTFAATANAVVHANGVPVFLDSGVLSMNIDPGSIFKILETCYRFDYSTKVWRSRNNGRILLAILVAHETERKATP